MISLEYVEMLNTWNDENVVIEVSPQHCVSIAAVLLFYLSLEYEFRLVGLDAD